MSRTAMPLRFPAYAFAAAVLIAGCAPPEPPDPERKPEPIAPAASATSPAQSETSGSALREAIQQPIDEAKAARDSSEEAARRQRAEIDAQTDG